MQVEPGVGGQPAVDRGGLVGGDVVEDDVDVQAGGDGFVDGGQELAELDGAVPGVQRPDHFPGGQVEGGVQVRGAGPLVVVAGAGRDAGHHREDRSGAVQRLDLGLLIDTQHHRPLGRVQVQAGDVADLAGE